MRQAPNDRELSISVPGAAGRFFAVGMSLSGTRPGIPVKPNREISIVVDPLTSLCLAGGVPGILGPTAGSLDAQGRAVVRVNANPLGSTVQGLRAWLAAVVLDPQAPDGISHVLGPELITFLRYAWADGNAVRADQSLSGGLAFTRPFGQEDDLAGIGLGWSEPTRPSRNEEFVAEAFYRLQLTRKQQLSVGWQAYFTPAFDPEDDVQHVLSLRWRVQF